jgi:ubiquinone/menaquinone biosynthesis C-methylase UbiE
VKTTSTDETLSPAAARALYDRIVRWQDTQRFYEDRAMADLVAHACLRNVRSVFEFGSGTGRLAERLLRDHLPATARYHGIDISSTMVALARERLSPWANRATALLGIDPGSLDTRGRAAYARGGCRRGVTRWGETV